MNSAVFFVISLYIGIPAITLLPMMLHDLISSISDSALLYLLAMVVLFSAVFWLIVVSGLQCIRKAKSFNTHQSVKIWKIMKLAPVPVYVVNYLYFMTFGIMIFPASVPLGFASWVFCLLSVLLSGAAGIICFGKIGSVQVKISKIHYALQLLPVLDVISTLILIARRKTVI